jgi:DNA-binding CsgD family transcriptional regulator
MHSPTGLSERFVGRHRELSRIEELIARGRHGHGGALVVRGEPGVGKTALLEQARRIASDLRLLDGWGSQFEAEVPFAALHQLCVPILGRMAELPAPHREALEAAFGLGPGAPDPFRVGLAMLELLAGVAHDSPVLCSIDDAHWLDASSRAVLTFVGRRVGAEPIVMLFAARPANGPGDLDALPGVEVAGLSAGEARTLLAELHVTLDEQVRERLIAEARGNPLALRELPRAGGYAAPDTTALPTRVERSFQARLAHLGADARRLLTLASADSTGAPRLLWDAARRLGLDLTNAGHAAAATGLVSFAGRVQFCHPLARSAVYRAASPDLRRQAHEALAAATDPVTDPDRRAWHRAEASAAPDDAVAADLERCAARARERGGMVAAAAFLERAAALTLDPATAVDRTLAAAAAHLGAAAPDAAERLLTTVEPGGLDECRRAEVDILRGRIAFTRHTDSRGPRHMLRAARRLAPVDPSRSRDTFLDALEMALVVGRADGVMDTVLTEARASAPPVARPDLLDALIRLDRDGHRAAVPLLRRLLDDRAEPIWTRRPALASILAAELWDPHTHSTIVDWLIKSGRASGSPFLLRMGLAQRVTGAALAGDVPRALVAVAEEEAIADAIGAPPLLYPRLYLAAVRGRRREALALFRSALATATEGGAGQLIANVYWAQSVFYNGQADYAAALAAAQRATEHGDLFLAGAALPELIEAAVRCGQPGLADEALAVLGERAEASGTPSSLGITAYARALVSGHEDDYREAIRHLDAAPLVPYRGRAHLLYGEWLRRQGRRRDSRDALQTAQHLLTSAGIEAFARRATTELRATGHTARSRNSTDTHHRLTAQETAIAQLAADGATTNEIAARLLLSPRTIDAHLRSIFRKLGIGSRRQLRDHPRLDG